MIQENPEHHETSGKISAVSVRIKPSELATWIRAAKLELREMTGLLYNPITGKYRLNAKDVSVNYMVRAVKPE